jgi:hypothetical protein
MNTPMEPATIADRHGALPHASIGRVPDNKITNSQTSYFSQSVVCRISFTPLPHLAATRWCGAERIFFNAVGTKVRPFEMAGNLTRDRFSKAVSAKCRKMPATSPKLQ